MKKKKFVLLLAMAIVAIGVSANAQSQTVTIYFNNPDSISATTTGSNSTAKITTDAAYYKEQHYAQATGGFYNIFVAKLTCVTAWYLPNETRDTSSSIGTSSSPGWNRAYFNSGETLRTDMTANGFNGTSMIEQSDTNKQ